jgi:hypothetical protein
MATRSLSELTPQQQQAAVILARLAAQKEVKRRRQKAGIKGPIECDDDNSRFAIDRRASVCRSLSWPERMHSMPSRAELPR